MRNVEDNAHAQSVIGEEGTILGMAKDEESKCWSYSVSISSTGDVWNLNERELKSTGKFQTRSDVYSGDRLKVQMDRDSGEGVIE